MHLRIQCKLFTAVYTSVHQCAPKVKEGPLRKLHLHLCYHLKEVRIVALPFYLYKMILEKMLRLNDLMAVCVHNLPLVILLMLSPLRNESENGNKINQNSSVNITVISYVAAFE